MREKGEKEEGEIAGLHSPGKSVNAVRRRLLHDRGALLLFGRKSRGRGRRGYGVGGRGGRGDF